MAGIDINGVENRFGDFQALRGVSLSVAPGEFLALARREAAWKFLRFATSPQGQALMVMNSGYVPCNQIAIDDPRWLGEFYRENPLFQAAVAQMTRQAPWFAFPGSNGVRITQAITNNTARVIETTATPEAALGDMASEVRRLLPRRS